MSVPTSPLLDVHTLAHTLAQVLGHPLGHAASDAVAGRPASASSQPDQQALQLEPPAACPAAHPPRPNDWLVLDASVDLAPPRQDGDYRASSGRAGWVAERIPGALHADLLEDFVDSAAPYSFAHPPLPQLAQALQRLGVTDRSRLVIYDRHDGFWSARLWWQLRSVGLASQVLDGGLSAWRRAGYALAHGEPFDQGDSPHSADPSLACQAEPPALQALPGFWVDREQVLAAVQGRAQATLVCALSAALFEGSAPSRYARRGHIPGSLNLPARQLFDGQGCYLRGPALRAALAALLAAPRPLWLYCGGGISAASQALALTLAGATQLAVYDGSLQEWAADPTLPLHTPALDTTPRLP